MKMTFEQYLEEIHDKQYIGPKGGVLEEGMLEDYERWIENIDVDDVIKYAEQWHAEQIRELTPIEPKTARKCLDKHSKMEKALNDAYDALRDGQSMQAKQIIGEVLGYEPRKED